MYSVTGPPSATFFICFRFVSNKKTAFDSRLPMITISLSLKGQTVVMVRGVKSAFVIL